MNEPSAGPLAWVNGSDAPEKSEINLGFMALSDCASVVVAATQGFAQPYGLTLNLKRQSSWAGLRDKLVSGELDAANLTPALKAELAAYSGTGGNLTGADGLQGSAVPSDPRIVELGVSRRVAQLPGIGGEYLFINTRRGLHGLRFDGHEDIDLAAQYRTGDDIADFVFRLAVNGRKPQPEVELFGVERADFYRDLFILQSGFAFAEARHRFYHCGGC